MSRDKRETVRYRGEDYEVLKRIRIGDRSYFLVKQVAHANRRRYMAICPAAPPDERKCAVYLFSRDKASRQHIGAWRKLSRKPNVIGFPRILSFGNHGDDVAVAATWVEGITLDEYLRDADGGVLTRRSPTNIMQCYTGLALALKQLHGQRGMIHGDINPTNLILTRNPQRIVVIDFGSAWMKATANYRDEGDGNTDPYAAPEQGADRQAVYEATDQFSASVVAYELLTGQLPYGGMGGRAGLPENRETYEPMWERPSRLSPHREDVPRRIWSRIDAILRRALSLSPEDRYPTDDAWLADLHGLRSEVDRKTEPSGGERWVIRCGKFLARLLNQGVVPL